MQCCYVGNTVHLHFSIIAQVCLRLATKKCHSKMCSFITQHNATDVASFEGACNWYADCRNVRQSGCPWIECSFIYNKPSPNAFQRIWQYIQPASQQQTRCNHTSPGHPHPPYKGLWYRQANVLDKQTQVHFIDDILNAQRYLDEILRPIVVPFIHNHHLMLQHDNARPHVARICTQFLEAENIPVLAWPAYSPDISPIEHVWDALDRRIRQRVPVPANIQQLRTAIEEEWTNITQATINNLINSMRRRCDALREANSGHTGYWLVFGPPPRHPNTVKLPILQCPFIVASLRHTCAIIMLSNQHLDMPHLWGWWIISAKEKCSLTQI